MRTIEEIRKTARILVIDDSAFPFKSQFEKDGYHIERWATIKNLSQLTDGHYHVILLDIHGVGLNVDPDRQGIGVLAHIKETNPAQPVLVYSAKPHGVRAIDQLKLADGVLDKSQAYVDYKSSIDRILTARSTPEAYIAMVNAYLGADVARAPKLVPRVLKAIQTGRVDRLAKYLNRALHEPTQIDRVLAIVSIGVTTVGLFQG
ncbi:hypothetical protein [Microbacterium sp. ER1]|uniref:hypothetical protein n=1 Tax=Microbacterium sp. ER1 TaxID=1932846 RepID=UPI00201AB199|nr:hypothetical protein [Microbacterium sp. ER1]